MNLPQCHSPRRLDPCQSLSTPYPCRLLLLNSPQYTNFPGTTSKPIPLLPSCCHPPKQTCPEKQLSSPSQSTITRTQLAYFLMVIGCRQAAPSSLRTETAFSKRSYWLSAEWKIGIENAAGTDIFTLIDSSNRPLSSFNYKIDVLYDICKVQPSLLHFLLVLLTRKLLFLLCSKSQGSALLATSFGLNKKESSSVSDYSCLILWSLARDKFIRYTCFRMLEMTSFLIGDASSPDVDVDSTLDSSCRMVLQRIFGPPFPSSPTPPIRRDFILFSTYSSLLPPRELEQGLRMPESACSLDCERETAEPCRILVIVPTAFLPLEGLPSSGETFSMATVDFGGYLMRMVGFYYGATVLASNC